MARRGHGSVTVLLRFIPFSLVAVNLTMRRFLFSSTELRLNPARQLRNERGTKPRHVTPPAD
jgi:hypothetical protein